MLGHRDVKSKQIVCFMGSSDQVTVPFKPPLTESNKWKVSSEVLWAPSPVRTLTLGQLGFLYCAAERVFCCKPFEETVAYTCILTLIMQLLAL